MGLAERLKTYRATHGRMSQKDLGDKIGVAQSQVSNYELGRHWPDRNGTVLLKIARVLDVPIEDLRTEWDNEHPIETTIGELKDELAEVLRRLASLEAELRTRRPGR